MDAISVALGIGVGALVGTIYTLYLIGKKTRTEAEEAWAIINELRAEDGASVTILYDNKAGVEKRIEVFAEWTGWENRRFYGRDLLDALKKALQAKGEAK